MNYFYFNAITVSVILSQGEIREEGKKGLKLPSPDSVLGSVDPSTCEPPGFCTMTKYLCSRVSRAGPH